MIRKMAVLGLLIAWCGPARAERGDVRRVVPTPSGRVTGLAFDGTHLWVADHREDRLFALDPRTGGLVRTIPSPCRRPTGLAADGRFLWVVDGPEHAAYRLDPQAGRSDRRIELEAARPRGLAWDGSHLVVADDWRDQIHEVDPEDGTSLRVFPAPSTGISGLAFANGALWVADRQDDALYAVDFETGRTWFWLPSPGPHPTGIAAVGGDLVVADYQDDSLAFVDLSLGKRPYRTFRDREVVVEFSWTFWNLGPDPVPDAQAFIAIPRSQPYQELHGPVQFDPPPAEVLREPGGQEVARFAFADIGAGKKVQVVATARATLRAIRYVFLPSETGGLQDIPPDISNAFVRDGSKLWLDHPRIREVAADLASRSRDYVTLVRNTYEYVIDHLSYDLAGGWNTAPMVLERGTGSCSEYSMTLMALLRANKVPVRFAGALVVRGDDASWDDVFHRWVEVFFPRVGWVPVDANKGDQERPAQRAAGFGELENRYLVTTLTPGDTAAMRWTYVYRSQYTCAGQCRVVEDATAEWSPPSAGAFAR